MKTRNKTRTKMKEEKENQSVCWLRYGVYTINHVIDWQGEQ
jgi:hypothetical protein